MIQQMETLENLVKEYHLENKVYLMGKVMNPYKKIYPAIAEISHGIVK